MDDQETTVDEGGTVMYDVVFTDDTANRTSKVDSEIVTLVDKVLGIDVMGEVDEATFKRLKDVRYIDANPKICIGK